MATLVVTLSMEVGTPYLAKPSVGAESSFPITQLYWSNWEADQSWQAMRFTVPDQDTTIPLNGGELRQYDAHIAKMFEVTHYLCQNKHTPNLWNWLKDNDVSTTSKLKRLDTLLRGKRSDEGFSWGYEAANGNVFMGRFDISCDLAKTVASAYGLDQAEPTLINRWYWIRDTNQKFVDENFVLEKYVIPKLKLTGKKVQKWMNFVQTFRPYFSDYYRAVEFEKQVTPFPVERTLSKLYWKTEVPILLPSELPSWEYRGVMYYVYARFGEQPILVKIANSMIEAGER